MAAHTPTLAREITRRRLDSGLGVGCAEAQADGVPCDVVTANCDHCARAGAEARDAVPREAGAAPALSPPKHR